MDIKQLETPCYIINEDEYINSIKLFTDLFRKNWGENVKFGYSFKTNHNPYLIGIAKDLGWEAEVVSNDEFQHALVCGFDKTNIILNGPNKGDALLEAINNNSIVNLDNFSEIEFLLNNLTEDKKANTCVGIRVNYDIEHDCPGETTTKREVGRFGFSYENGELSKAIKLLETNGIKVIGLHMHQSSSTRSLNIYSSICNKVIQVVSENSLAHLKYIDIGGGYFGGNYFPNKPSFEDYSYTITSILKTSFDPKIVTLILEPGAAVLATSMDYLTSIVDVRDIRSKRVVTVDGSVLHINPFMNPHETPFSLIGPINEECKGQIVGGSTCMELDRFYPRELKTALTKKNQLLFHCCGAYMSTHNSNFINCAPNIYTKNGNSYSLIRKKDIFGMSKQ